MIEKVYVSNLVKRVFKAYNDKENPDYPYYIAIIADGLTAHPEIVKEIEKIYQCDKFRYYDSIRNLDIYNNVYVTSRSLGGVLAMRRAMGVLVCIDDGDEEAQRRLTKTLNSRFNDILKVLKRKKEDEIIKLLRDKHDTAITNHESYNRVNSYNRIAFYMIRLNFSFDNEWETMFTEGKFLMSTFFPLHVLTNGKVILPPSAKKELIEQSKQSLRQQQPSIKMFLKIASTELNRLSAWDNIYFLAERGVRDIPELFSDKEIDIEEALIGAGYLPKIMNFIHSLSRILHVDIMGGDNHYDMVGISGKIAIAFQIFRDILELEGFDPIGIATEAILSAEEFKALLQIRINANKLIHGDNFKIDDFNVVEYTIFVLFWLLVKQHKLDHEFYFANSAETQFLELKSQQASLSKLEEENKELRSQLKNAQEKYEQLKRETDKKIATATAQANEELRKNRQALKFAEAEKEELQSNTQELHKLREFIFEQEAGYTPTESSKTLKELIEGKKIVIIGGHENWRKKIKNTYPSLYVYDGRIEAFDFVAALNYADHVFFFTGNMNHKVYYKCIDFLRTSKVPYDYLGRTLNQDLFEAEMIDLLTR